MERIALFGGMFDPVHNGHLCAATAVADQLALDKVIFIPARIPPHKNGVYLNGEQRLFMLECATRQDERFLVSDFELMQQGVSYSYITAEHFAHLYPKAKLYFLIGDEAYNLLHTWKMPERIRAVAEFAVVTRDQSPPPEDALYVKMPPVHISSTFVRQKIQAGEDVTALLPPDVARYIKENHLYEDYAKEKMGNANDGKRNDGKTANDD